MRHYYPVLYTYVLLGLSAVSTAQVQLGDITPKHIIGGMGEVLKITGLNFGSLQGSGYVSFLKPSGSYMDSSASANLKYVTWSDTAIEVEMPNAYSAPVKLNIGGVDYLSNDTLHVNANLNYRDTNPLDYDYLNNRNNQGGFTWHMHRTYWENPEAKAAIEDVIRELRCQTGVNYILADGPSDATLTLSDTINLIAPDSNLAAVGYNDKLWASCIFGPDTLYITQALDVRLSTSQNWYFGAGAVPNGKVKFRYVLFHELGHSLGLGHVNELGQTMYPSVSYLPSENWNQRDSLTAEERTAISHFVQLSQNFTLQGCGMSPMLPIQNCENVYGFPVSARTIEKKEHITVFPNPSDGIFTIQTTGEVSHIQVWSLLGSLLYSCAIDANRSTFVDLSDYPNGTYFVRAFDGAKESLVQPLLLVRR